MADQNPDTKALNQQPRADTNGVVQAPVGSDADTPVDNLPQGAVFTEVAADKPLTPTAVTARSAVPSPQPRPIQDVIARREGVAPKPVSTPVNTAKPTAAKSNSKLVLALILVTFLFIVLSALAYLAYSHSK